MNELVSKILEIDRNARERVQTAGEKKTKILKETKTESEEIRSSVTKRAEDKISETERIEKEKADSEISVIREKTDGKIRSMNAVFDEKHEQWEQEIFQRIIGG